MTPLRKLLPFSAFLVNVILLTACQPHQPEHPESPTNETETVDTRVRAIDAPAPSRATNSTSIREFQPRNPAAASRRDAYNARRAEATTSATSTGIVRGRVVRLDSEQPVANASVTALAKGNKTPLGPWLTTADGAFQATELPAGDIRFSVNDSAGKPLYIPSREFSGVTRILLKQGETTDTLLRVFEGYTITGMVYDKETSEVLKGAKIAITDDKVPPVVSGDDGHYALSGVPPQSGVILKADLAGFVIATSSISDSYFALPEGTYTATKNIPMVPSVLVTGQVVNSAGDGIGGAKLNWSSNASRNTPSAIADANGYFQFPVEPLRDGSLVIEASGYAWKRESVTVRNEDLTDLRIVLETAGKISGKVIDADNKGVNDASVTIDDTYSIAFTRLNSLRQIARSNADGTFTADDIASGSYTLTATADGHAPGTARVTIREGQTTTGVEIRLGEELTIEGRVVDAQDKPVSADIIAFGLSIPQVSTDSDGHFVIRGLKPGNVQLWVMARKAGLRKEVTTKAGTKDLVIRMADFANVHCLVIDALTKEPINKFEVDNAGSISREGEPSNGFRISMEPKGIGYRMPSISAEGYATKSLKVEVPDKPGEYHQTMEMGVGGGVRGRVIDAATGDPIKDVAISQILFGGSEESGRKAYSDTQGAFELPGLPSGSVSMSVIGPQPYAEIHKNVEITEGEITDIGDIKLGGTGSILLRTLDPDGKPAPNEGINIGFREILQNIMNPHTDENGDFLFKDLSPGDYTLFAFQESRKVVLEPNENKVVEFRQGPTSWSGTVTTGGQLLQDGQVKLTNNADGSDYTASIKQGRFSFPHLSPGDYSVDVAQSITVPFGGGTSTSHKSVHKESITIPDGPTFVKDFALP